MRISHLLVKKYPLTTILIIVIWVICVIPIPESPLNNISMIDKWTHIAMYFALSMVIAWERHRNAASNLFTDTMVYVWLLPTMMGGVLELVQAYCTGGTRSGDGLDFFADAIGSTLAALICILLARFRAKG